MLQNENVDEVVIDEALDAISEGDREGALSLLEIVAKARALRVRRARKAVKVRRAASPAPRRQLVEA